MSPFGRTLSCVAVAALGACSSPNYGTRTDEVSASDAGDAAAAPLRNADAGARGELPDASVRDAREVSSERDASAPIEQPEQPEQPEVDASMIDVEVGPRTPVVPAWAEPLRGPYASRSYQFRQDEFDVITRATFVMLHQFVLAPDGLVLRSKICSYRATTLLAEMTMNDPSGAPERVEKVLFSETEQRWSTDGASYQYGYTRELPAICKDKLGESVTKPVDHVWNLGTTCRCADAAEEPLADDCRVLDPDGDRHPGFTYHLMGTAIAGEADVFGAVDSASQLVNGRLRTDRTLSANIRPADISYQLGCLPDGCTNIAKLGRWCPTTFNTTEFVPLTGEAPSCASVLAALGTLFPAPDAAFPARCFQ